MRLWDKEEEWEDAEEELDEDERSIRHLDAATFAEAVAEECALPCPRQHGHFFTGYTPDRRQIFKSNLTTPFTSLRQTSIRLKFNGPIPFPN